MASIHELLLKLVFNWNMLVLKHQGSFQSPGASKLNHIHFFRNALVGEPNFF